ncbi:MAG: GLPGLI family protein [Saprospiraceae bacterium]
MIKLYILSSLMLSTSQVYGQDKSGGEAFYTWLSGKGTTNEAAAPHFKLRFNENESRFFFVNDDDEIPFTLQFVLAKNKNIYTNRETKKMLEAKKGFKKVKMFLIESKLEPRDWEITSETKKIGNYTCQKATTSREIYEGGRFLFIEYAEAWFTDSIPFSFGPEKYGGLPGLILELKIKRLKEDVFKISHLELLSNVEIIEPTDGELVLYKDYDDKIKKMYDEAELKLRKMEKDKQEKEKKNE